mgnify:FL=1
MSISLHLDKMSTIEKIKLMESLWEDLSKKSNELSSPSWHGEILNKRDVSLSEGKDSIHDWAATKTRIRKTIE